MTPAEERRLFKAYEQRRAGMGPDGGPLTKPDKDADDVVLNLLRVVGRDQAGRLLPARVLTDKEKEKHREGGLVNEIRGEIMTAAAAHELEQQRLGKVRAEAATKAARASSAARRLEAEAARLREG
jgi:hypothetical protein